MGFQLVIGIGPSVARIIVDKQTGIPRTVQTLGPAMKAFTRFVKQHVAWFEQDFMTASVKVFNINGPRLGVLTAINV